MPSRRRSRLQERYLHSATVSRTWCSGCVHIKDESKFCRISWCNGYYVRYVVFTLQRCAECVRSMMEHLTVSSAVPLFVELPFINCANWSELENHFPRSVICSHIVTVFVSTLTNTTGFLSGLPKSPDRDSNTLSPKIWGHCDLHNYIRHTERRQAALRPKDSSLRTVKLRLPTFQRKVVTLYVRKQQSGFWDHYNL